VNFVFPVFADPFLLGIVLFLSWSNGVSSGSEASNPYTQRIDRMSIAARIA
jgi:hypothetical protein